MFRRPNRPEWNMCQILGALCVSPSTFMPVCTDPNANAQWKFPHDSRLLLLVRAEAITNLDCHMISTLVAERKSPAFNRSSKLPNEICMFNWILRQALD